jgi:uncharacterized protein
MTHEMTQEMALRAIHRHPVKAMGGEQVESVEIDSRGLVGDRGWAVVDADGHFASGKNTRRMRRHDAVFDYRATITASGVFVSGRGGHWRAGDPVLDEELSGHFGVPVTMQPERGTPFFDAGSVSLVGTATLDWCREHDDVDADHRRLRANLLVDTDEPFVEEAWAGRVLEVGQVQLRVTRRITRCRMIDLAQNGLSETTGWLKTLGPRDLQLAMYADVVTAGRVFAGQPVRVRD